MMGVRSVRRIASISPKPSRRGIASSATTRRSGAVRVTESPLSRDRGPAIIHRPEGGGWRGKKSGRRAKEVLRTVAGERGLSEDAKQSRIRVVPDKPVHVELANGSAE